MMIFSSPLLLCLFRMETFKFLLTLLLCDFFVQKKIVFFYVRTMNFAH